MIYFIQAVGSGHIKIGLARDVKKRIRGLQTGSSYLLRIIGIIDAPDSLEKELHKKFAKFKIKNEWFRPDPELLAYIKSMCKDALDQNKGAFDGWDAISEFGLWPTLKESGGFDEPLPIPPKDDEVEACTEFIRLYVSFSENINRKSGTNSYWLKHWVEYWSSTIGKRMYISNGALILAASRLGFVVERVERGSPSAYFNMKFSKELGDIRVCPRPVDNIVPTLVS